MVASPRDEHKSKDSSKVLKKDRESEGDDAVAPGDLATRDQSSNGSKLAGQEQPPLPDEVAPPLPAEAPPDDGWDPVWDATAQAYYFFNRFTQASQWENPRVPENQQVGLGNHDRIDKGPPGTEKEENIEIARRPHGGYDPAIHGDYDPTAPYAQAEDEDRDGGVAAADPAAIYAQSGAFNRWTGKWQRDEVNPENHNDENKSKRQMSAFFDVDAAANSHNGRSLKAERSGKKLTKQELKAFKEKRKEKKEEKRRAWLRD